MRNRLCLQAILSRDMKSENAHSARALYTSIINSSTVTLPGPQPRKDTPRYGLYYYGYRYYDPVTGRWPSRDPLGERAGDNLYEMVLNNPIHFVDVLGLRVANPPPLPRPTPRPSPGTGTRLRPARRTTPYYPPVLPRILNPPPGISDVTFYDPATGETQTEPYRDSGSKKAADALDQLDKDLVDYPDRIPKNELKGWNMMRIQLQEGTNNIESLPVYNVAKIGVSVLQINYAWDTVIKPACNKLPRKCRSQCVEMIEKMKQHVRGFPPAGNAERKDIGRKQFCCSANNKWYRADLENKRGHNIRR